VQTLSFPETKDEGWFEGEGWGMIRHFTDGQWVGDQVGISGYHNSIDFVDNHNGWTVGDRILHTTNGYEWVEQTNHPGLESALLDVCFININEGWAVGATGQVLKTSGGGSLWENDPPGTDELFTAVQFTSSTNGFIIGNNKAIYRYTQISDVEEQGGMGAGGHGGVEVWPNPTSGKFQITSTKHQTNSKFKIKNSKLGLVDLYGKSVTIKNNRTIEQLNNETVEFDISHLPPGIYFLRINLENQLIVMKIIKI
jgi:hypothetical protein